MKRIKIFLYIVLVGIVFTLYSCSKLLDEPVYSQLAPENFLTTQSGIESVLDAAFGEGYISGYDSHSSRDIENWCTDIEWETGGGENRDATLMINFTWDASVDWMYSVMWARPYRAIRNANTVLDNVDAATLSDDQRTGYKAEARFIRALSYYHLYTWFGPTPLRKSLTDSLELSKATDAEMQSFIESELLAVIPDLPDPGKEKNYGRPNKGAAMGLLCKFYLNTKQWQKCADMAKEITAINVYNLYPDFEDLFKVENERNSEFILVDPQIAQGDGNNYINGAFPPSFAKDPVSGLTMQSNWNNWGAQYRLYDAFYNSFEQGDKRKNLILTSYVNSGGATVSLLNADNIRSFKYWPDPNAISNDHGNDIAEVRYADILLSEAESLNELNGPTQEAIDLINQVRERAGLPDLILSSFSSKESLKVHLLLERGWEFYTEVGIRREDQIRMGTFVSSAIARGHTNAKPTMVVFPIPQTAMDANPKLVQNDGY
jgi:hypothetical protein